MGAYIGFDAEGLRMLTRLHNKRCGESVECDDKADELIKKKHLDTILDNIVFNDGIIMIVSDLVYDEIKNESNVVDFVKQYGNSLKPKTNAEKIQRFQLAELYCHDFHHGYNKIGAAYEKDKNGNPSNTAMIVADATLGDYQFVAWDTLRYIKKPNETCENERALGVMIKNKKMKIYGAGSFKKVTHKPMAIENVINLIYKYGIEKFHTNSPEYVNRKIDFDVM